MCGRYISVQKKEILEKVFDAKMSDAMDFEPNYNISVGDYAPVITNNGSILKDCW